MENLLLTIDRLHSDSMMNSHPSVWTAPLRTASGVEPRGEASKGFPVDLSVVSTRRLRVLCNRRYELLDNDYPPMDAREQYEALAEELDRRETRAETRLAPDVPRGTFRDNPLSSRFELFREGIMAGYVKYEMRGGEILLLQTVVDPRFHMTNVEPLLIQRVLLNAHRRRLVVTPYCPVARGFLADHPQYLTLLSARQRRRFEVQATRDRER